ncbi:hypothetical protein [Oryzomonas sagensis]|uniref:hypothetical protein n=1 Tax=Oryzomonas sagensis TaxID=2603857 RepID=UPI0017805B19|nr:hypothetical protein [Oryzomonas sagensis]
MPALMIAAALLAGGAAIVPRPSWAGSCCGGGSPTSLLVPKYARAVADLSLDMEIYDGFWNQDGRHTPDPPGSDLKQYRVNLGYAQRFFRDWQASVVLPYVWNDNNYSGVSSHSDGLGDATVSLWYELFEDTSAWRVREPEDMIPSVNLGLSLLLPTGISPYDDEKSSFDITGRGFYRLDGNLLIEKTIQPWSASVALSYGTYFERSVNREYGRYVEPYRKQLGDRLSVGASLSYSYVLGTGGDQVIGTVSYTYLTEGDGSFNGMRDGTTAFTKQSVGGTLAYANTDSDWTVRAGWNHAIQADGWGKNFPTTDIITVGVRYAFR